MTSPNAGDCLLDLSLVRSRLTDWLTEILGPVFPPPKCRESVCVCWCLSARAYACVYAVRSEKFRETRVTRHDGLAVRVLGQGRRRGHPAAHPPAVAVSHEETAAQSVDCVRWGMGNVRHGGQAAPNAVQLAGRNGLKVAMFLKLDPNKETTPAKIS